MCYETPAKLLLSRAGLGGFPNTTRGGCRCEDSRVVARGRLGWKTLCHSLAGYPSRPSVCYSAPIPPGSGLDFLLPASVAASWCCPRPTHPPTILSEPPHRRPPQVPSLPAPGAGASWPFESSSRCPFPLYLRTPALPGKMKTHLSPNPPAPPHPSALACFVSTCHLPFCALRIPSHFSRPSASASIFQEVFCYHNFFLWAVVSSSCVDLTLGPLPKAVGGEGPVKVYCCPPNSWLPHLL